MAANVASAVVELNAPDVYVDVLFDDGLLYFVVCNDGPVAVTRVRMKFDNPVLGADGINFSDLAIFTKLEFLAPGKRIPIFFDHARTFYARRHRSRIGITVQWRIGRQEFQASMLHDMRVYADLPYIVQAGGERRLGRTQL